MNPGRPRATAGWEWLPRTRTAPHKNYRTPHRSRVFPSGKFPALHPPSHLSHLLSLVLSIFDFDISSAFSFAISLEIVFLAIAFLSIFLLLTLLFLLSLLPSFLISLVLSPSLSPALFIFQVRLFYRFFFLSRLALEDDWQIAPCTSSFSTIYSSWFCTSQSSDSRSISSLFLVRLLARGGHGGHWRCLYGWHWGCTYSRYIPISKGSFAPIIW